MSTPTVNPVNAHPEHVAQGDYTENERTFVNEAIVNSDDGQQGTEEGFEGLMELEAAAMDGTSPDPVIEEILRDEGLDPAQYEK